MAQSLSMSNPCTLLKESAVPIPGRDCSDGLAAPSRPSRHRRRGRMPNCVFGRRCLPGPGRSGESAAEGIHAMNTLVLLAGIADPKWPLPRPLTADALRAHQAQHQVLGPFDEAALEVALKLRDAAPDMQLRAIVVGGEALARQVAGFRIDTLVRLDPAALAPWSTAELAAALRASIDALPDLLLIGREFGDHDDGSVPAHLAQWLALPHVSLALSMQRVDAGLRIVRQGGETLQRVDATLPLLASVTNDSHNRLRQPLLKNVMATRKMRFEAALSDAPSGVVALASIEAATVGAREKACRFLGGTVDQQADELAGILSRLGEAA
ncbi:electron transfer flavoprotein subunit beta/FixA family protein [Variovorax sp. PBL-E5]|uniref:electron transfer flavoprotein subunit beta/FixA family protein n=1 Tax=Variovorax sp. PBL-E5 TaxID=434014 RepID=UPI0013A58A67|nr:electron transfer flavoprotein subunit beta [Variovorax sp. PBL-E5]